MTIKQKDVARELEKFIDEQLDVNVALATALMKTTEELAILQALVKELHPDEK